MNRSARKAIARKRLVNILSQHTVALARTIEQKIADAGPYNQRVDPHVITEARQELESEGIIQAINKQGTEWYTLTGTSRNEINQRLAEQEPIHDATNQQPFKIRLGQALEIAIYRALSSQNTIETFGRFPDLETHDDSQPYSKEEPPSGFANRAIPTGQRLDFLIRHPDNSVGWAGIEAKNVRQWIYPKRREVRDLLAKCIYLDAVPILIARRIHFSTFRVLNPSGLVIWQTLRQRYPEADSELADQARHKRLLGYADIRLGNETDGPLRSFLQEKLTVALPEARDRFNRFKDLIAGYAIEDMPYKQFAARVRRRSEGRNEDNDWDETEDQSEYDDD